MKKETNETKREPVRNGITELVFVLDRSGSMAGLESDTIGGFNGLLEKQRRVDGKCFVSTVLFDHETLVLHDRLPLEQVENLTDRDYQVRGCTALIDALGGAIRHIGNVHKYARPEDVPESTLFVVITDGLENASKRYTADEVRAMISRQNRRGPRGQLPARRAGHPVGVRGRERRRPPRAHHRHARAGLLAEKGRRGLSEPQISRSSRTPPERVARSGFLCPKAPRKLLYYP